ncbi:unnamed protein product, partial [Cyprideis torosa]
MFKSSSCPDFCNVGQKQETDPLPVFSLTCDPGSSDVVLQTGDEDPVLLPLVSRGHFDLNCHECLTYRLYTFPPEILFLLLPDPDRSRLVTRPTIDLQDILDSIPESWRSAVSMHLQPPSTTTFDQGKVEERLTYVHYEDVIYEDEEVTYVQYEKEQIITSRTSLHWLHVFTLLPGYHPVVKLLLAQKADPNSTDEVLKQTPLHMAKTSETVEVLIDNKADVNAKDRWGQTPLHFAAKHNRHSIAKVLLDNGADPNIPDVFEQTPLHLATSKQNEEVIKCLVANGARLDVKNKKGKTALDIARAKGFAHIAYHFPGHLQNGRFERDFEVVKDGILGEGSFGRVFKAKMRGTDDVYAIKEIPFPPEDAKKTLREVRVVMGLSGECENILTHHDAWLEDRRPSDGVNQ